MDYKSFKECIKQEMEHQYPEAKVIINSVDKNNGTKLDGLVVKMNNEMLVPCIYLNQYYDEYKQGTSIQSIVREITTHLLSGRSATDNSQCKSFIDNFSKYASIRDHIIYKVINYEQNQELLSKVPHTRFLDLAVVYMILIKDSSDSMGTVLIRNEHLNLWGITFEQIHAKAMDNTPNILPAQIESMETVISGLLEVGEMPIKNNHDSSMFIMSNKSGINGAATLLYPNIISKFRDEYCSNSESIVILPSSIHELILLPGQVASNIGELKQMVREVNNTQVAKEEVLSNEVYVYHISDGQIHLLDE